MKTFNVLKASVLRAANTKNKKAQIIITLADADERLLLSPKQCLVALQDGGRLINQTIDDIYDADNDLFSPEFVMEVANMRGGEIVGDITLHEAGDEYVLGANHPDVKLGKAKATDKRKYEKSGLGVNGLCTIYSGQVTRELVAFAEAKAKLTAFVPKSSLRRRVESGEGNPQDTLRNVFNDVE